MLRSGTAAAPHIPVSALAPTAIMNADQASFLSATGWSTATGLSFDTTPPGYANIGPGTANVATQHQIAAMTIGRTYTMHFGLAERVAGIPSTFMRTGPTGTNSQKGGAGYIAAHLIRSFEATEAFDYVRVSATGTPELAYSDVQIYDIQPLIDQPKAIFIEAGQSNRVGAWGVTGYDPLIDTPEFRALAVPSITQTVVGAVADGTGPTYGAPAGTGIGSFMTMSSPIGHLSGVLITDGSLPSVGPYLHEAKTLADDWRYPGYTPTFLLAAASGTGLETHWSNTDVPNGYALRMMKASIDALLAENPANFVAGMFWQQGEGSVYTTYNAYFTTWLAELRALYGDFPVVMAEIGGIIEPGGPIANMITEQQKLDKDSGHANAIHKLKYVPRPVDFVLEDEGGAFIHFTGATNRTFGINGANAMLTMLP